LVMNQIRESFGPEETASALPASAVSKIAAFERELASWQSRHANHSKSFLLTSS
jgi:hypothetical protein